jgi:hypothetical protein
MPSTSFTTPMFSLNIHCAIKPAATPEITTGR